MSNPPRCETLEAQRSWYGATIYLFMRMFTAECLLVYTGGWSEQVDDVIVRRVHRGSSRSESTVSCTSAPACLSFPEELAYVGMTRDAYRWAETSKHRRRRRAK